MSAIFVLDPSPKGKETKAQITKYDFIKCFCIAKETTNKKITYGIRENICKWCDP